MTEPSVNREADVVIDLHAYSRAGGVLPSQVAPAFNDQAALSRKEAAPVADVKQENNARHDTAKEGIQQIDHSLHLIKKAENPGPDQQPAQKAGGGYTGVFARAAIGGLLTMAVPGIAPLAAGAALVDTGVTAFRSAATERPSNTGNTQKKDNVAAAPSPTGSYVAGTFDHAANAQRTAAMQGAPGDIRAVNQATLNCAKGAAGIHERAHIARDSLGTNASSLNLKTELLDRRQALQASLDNAKDVHLQLNQRKEKGVELTDKTVVAAVQKGAGVSALMNQKAAFGV